MSDLRHAATPPGRPADERPTTFWERNAGFVVIPVFFVIIGFGLALYRSTAITPPAAVRPPSGAASAGFGAAISGLVECVGGLVILFGVLTALFRFLYLILIICIGYVGMYYALRYMP